MNLLPLSSIRLVRLFLLLRPRQWVKNSVVLLAPFASGKIFAPEMVRLSVLLIVSYVSASSLGYILNDWLDKDSDREHQKKRHRPIASGSVSRLEIVFLAMLMTTLLIITFTQLPEQVVVMIVLYLLLTFLYSFRLKNFPIIDILTLTCGFVLRLLAGAALYAVHVSIWLFLFTSFAVLFIISSKRVSEKTMFGNAGTRAVLQSYSLFTLQVLVFIGKFVAISSYAIWALFERGFLAQISALFVLAGFLRFAKLSRNQEGEAPEIIFTTDTPIILHTVLTLVLVGIEIY